MLAGTGIADDLQIFTNDIGVAEIQGLNRQRMTDGNLQYVRYVEKPAEILQIEIMAGINTKSSALGMGGGAAVSIEHPRFLCRAVSRGIIGRIQFDPVGTDRRGEIYLCGFGIEKQAGTDPGLA